MTALYSSLAFLIEILGSLYIMGILVRFLLQLVRADFYNPMSKAIVKVTSPLLNPIRKIVPSYGNIDVASLILALLFQIGLLYSLLFVSGYSPTQITFTYILISSLIKLCIGLLNIYMYSSIIIAIASWVAPGSYNPGLMLLTQIVNPLTSRIRKIIPPFGGLDFSLMILVIVIITLKNFLANF